MSVKIGNLDSTTIKLGDNIVSKIYLGNNELFSYVLPGEGAFATLTSTSVYYDVALSSKSTTGYIKVELADLSTNVWGDGNGSSTINFFMPPSNVQLIKIYPSDSSGNLVGALTSLGIDNYYQLDTVDISGCESLHSLSMNLGPTDLESLDLSNYSFLKHLTIIEAHDMNFLNLSGLTSLQSLNITLADELESPLDLSDLESLTSLTLDGVTPPSPYINFGDINKLQNVTIYNGSTNFYKRQTGPLDFSNFIDLNTLSLSYTSTSLNVSGCESLQTIYLEEISGMTSLDCNNLTALMNLSLLNTSITSLNINNTLPNSVYISNTPLASLRAVNTSFGGSVGVSYYGGPTFTGGVQINGTNLSSGALDQFYTDLGITSAGIIAISSTAGTDGDDPTIATAKGYTVYGS